MLDDTKIQSASHAWAEVHLDGLGWVGFDISNAISPDNRYINRFPVFVLALVVNSYLQGSLLSNDVRGQCNMSYCVALKLTRGLIFMSDRWTIFLVIQRPLAGAFPARDRYSFLRRAIWRQHSRWSALCRSKPKYQTKVSHQSFMHRPCFRWPGL